MTDPYTRGFRDCVQDSYENCPFSSVGGIENRDHMTTPKYIKENKEEYLYGYIAAAVRLYGEDWKTCKFTWKPALTINPKED